MGWIEDRLDEEFAPWRDSLTGEEVEALLNYQGNNHSTINAFFRDPDQMAATLSDVWFEVIEEVTLRVDAAIERGVLQRDVMCYRGLRDYARLFGSREPSELPGFGFEERAYCSTSTDEFRAMRFTTSRGCVLTFEAPDGMSAAWMPALAHETFRRQRELLLPRGLWFRVEDVWEESDTLWVKARIE